MPQILNDCTSIGVKNYQHPQPYRKLTTTSQYFFPLDRHPVHMWHILKDGGRAEGTTGCYSKAKQAHIALRSFEETIGLLLVDYGPLRMRWAVQNRRARFLRGFQALTKNKDSISPSLRLSAGEEICLGNESTFPYLFQSSGNKQAFSPNYQRHLYWFACFLNIYFKQLLY